MTAVARDVAAAAVITARCAIEPWLAFAVIFGGMFLPPPAPTRQESARDQ